MKWFFGVIATLLVLVVMAIVLAPASLIPLALTELETRGLRPSNAPKLTLSDTQGTLWIGSSQQSVLLIDGVELELGRVSWQINPMTFLDRAFSINLKIASTEHQIEAKILATEQGEVTVRDLEGRFPLAIFEPWVPMVVKGDVAFVVDLLVFNQRQLLALDGLLKLEYVDWILGEHDMPLGSYMAQLSLDDSNQISIQLNDFSATLGVDGYLTLNPRGSYHFDATLTPRSGLAPEIAQSIVWFGKKDRQGNVLINKRGQF